MFWRSAASSSVSPGLTWKVWPLGSRRTVRMGAADTATSAGAAELPVDDGAADVTDRAVLDDGLGAWQEQQREGDEVGDHAREDEEQAREDGTGAVGKCPDGEAPLGETRRKPGEHGETRFLDERHAGAGGEDHPRENPPS